MTLGNQEFYWNRCAENPWERYFNFHLLWTKVLMPSTIFFVHCTPLLWIGLGTYQLTKNNVLKYLITGNRGGEPEGDLLTAINRDFGSLENMKTKLSGSTVAVQGSGWGWLGYDKAAGRLAIATCANQDPLEATTGLVPLLGIDVWEHAYYLQYKNVRPDYVKAIFDVVNWDNVAQRLADAQWMAGLLLLLLLLNLYE